MFFCWILKNSYFEEHLWTAASESLFAIGNFLSQTCITMETIKQEIAAGRSSVGSSPKYIRKNPARRIKKDLKNIILYSRHESSKADECPTFLVSFITPLSWPEWFRPCFVTWCKIFSKITHQTTRRETRPKTAPFFIK